MFDSEEFDFDLSQQGTDIKAGIYEVECISWEKSQTKAHKDSGALDDNCVIMEVMITHDEHGVPVENPDSIKEWLLWSRKAMWKMEQVLVALGVASPGKKVKFASSDVVGKRCLAAVEIGSYNGRTRLQIGEYRLHPKGPVRQPTEGPGRVMTAADSTPF